MALFYFLSSSRPIKLFLLSPGWGKDQDRNSFRLAEQQGFLDLLFVNFAPCVTSIFRLFLLHPSVEQCGAAVTQITGLTQHFLYFKSSMS